MALKLSPLGNDRLTSSTRKPVKVMSSQIASNKTMVIGSPTGPDANGNASMPAPMDVPVTNKVQLSVLFI